MIIWGNWQVFSETITSEKQTDNLLKWRPNTPFISANGPLVLADQVFMHPAVENVRFSGAHIFGVFVIINAWGRTTFPILKVIYIMGNCFVRNQWLEVNCLRLGQMRTYKIKLGQIRLGPEKSSQVRSSQDLKKIKLGQILKILLRSGWARSQTGTSYSRIVSPSVGLNLREPEGKVVKKKISGLRKGTSWKIALSRNWDNYNL